MTAALINALKLANKAANSIKLIINGAGAAGISIALMLTQIGIQNIIVLDSQGCIFKNRENNMNTYK